MQGRIKVVAPGRQPTTRCYIHTAGALARFLSCRSVSLALLLDLVIVRDMWLTGFDSPSMHTMYGPVRRGVTVMVPS
jgi:type I restriction enzyme, R subunit